MCLSHDIWDQVIRYFEHQADDSDATEKRVTLFNLAVVSRSLSSLALATLWKDIDSLEPIVGIINYFTPAGEDALLRWVNGNKSEYWVFPGNLLNRDQVNSRVKEYLRLIRVFRASGEEQSEQALWTILTAWFWETKPLLSNLQTLFVSFEGVYTSSFHYVTLMVPPTLERIAMTEMEPSDHPIMFFQLLLSQGCSPARVEYGGDVALPHTIILLKKLHTLEVWGPYKHQKHNSPFSFPELLNQLPYLKYLDINLETLRIQTPAPLDPFEHLALESLLLRATTEELQPLFSSVIVCPLVKDFVLEVEFNTDLTVKFLLEKVIKILPNLKDLTFSVLSHADAPQLSFSDLHKLLSQPMESFFLNCPNTLSQSDLQQMFTAWPELQTLSLVGSKTPFNAEALLSTLTCRNLRDLQLPWDFTSLSSTLSRPPVTQKHPLKKIRAVIPTKFPTNLREKVTLAGNLLMLFPEIELFHSQALTPEADDLQIIIKGMRFVAEGSHTI